MAEKIYLYTIDDDMPLRGSARVIADMIMMRDARLRVILLFFRDNKHEESVKVCDCRVTYAEELLHRHIARTPATTFNRIA